MLLVRSALSRKARSLNPDRPARCRGGPARDVDLRERWPGFFPIRVVSIGVSRLMLWWRRIPSFGRRCSAVRRSGCSGRYVKRRVFVRPLRYKVRASIQRIGPREVHLADIDAVVAEDREGHHDMEIDVRDRHLQQVVLAAKDLAGRPGEADLLRCAAPAYCASVTLSANATVFRMRARTSSIVCLLVILVLGRRLPWRAKPPPP